MKTRLNDHQPSGFTLVELMVVMIIIGIVVALIAVVSLEGVRRAEERATQALIIKLEAGLNDRIDALLTQPPTIGNAHRFLATPRNTALLGLIPSPAEQRAEVIARIDMLRRELPETWMVNPSFSQNPTDYPINFGGTPYLAGTSLYSGLTGAAATHAPYVLPLGAMANFIPGALYTGSLPAGDLDPSLGIFSPGQGIYGASYAAASGILKNLGNLPVSSGTNAPYLPTGYDGADNNGNGLVDEWVEGVNATNQSAVLASLANHQPETARSEVLYSILVEGQGPFGSIFSRDDFTTREVQDTDGDGLPEFVDAWGKPLQFFLWPTAYRSTLQRGIDKYPSALVLRATNQLDPNNQLMATNWWSFSFNDVAIPGVPASARANPILMSDAAHEFQRHFMSLFEPYDSSATDSFYDPESVLPTGIGTTWDRGGTTPPLGSRRRAYAARFLILSGGRDRNPGVTLLPNNPSDPLGLNPLNIVQIENQGAPFSRTRSGPTFPGNQIPSDPASNVSGKDTPGTTFFLYEAGQDDISNHNIQTGAGGAL